MKTGWIGIAVVVCLGLAASAPGQVEWEEPILPVEWAGGDEGSGLSHVFLHYRRDGGPVRLYGDRYTTTPITFDSRQTGGDGLYDFWVTGVDYAGNAEDRATTPEWSVRVATMPPLHMPILNTGVGLWAPGTSLTLYWTNTETSYPLTLWWQDVTSSTAPGVLTVSAGSERATVGGLIHNHRYRYRVQYFDPALPGRVSPWSAMLYVTQDAVDPVTWVLPKALVVGPMLRNWRRLR